MELDIPYARCPEEREYGARLSNLVVLLKSVNVRSSQVDVYKVLDKLYDVLPFLENLGRVIEVAIAALNIECKLQGVPCLRARKAVKCLRFPCLVVACYISPFSSGGVAMSAIAS